MSTRDKDMLRIAVHIVIFEGSNWCLRSIIVSSMDAHRIMNSAGSRTNDEASQTFCTSGILFANSKIAPNPAVSIPVSASISGYLMLIFCRQ